MFSILSWLNSGRQLKNFRLADRLVTQINRILDINKQTRLIPEAVDAAQEALLIGR